MPQTILTDQVTSHETSGTKHHPPFEVDRAIEREANARIRQYPAEQKRSAVLPLLHIVQSRFGYISSDAIEWVATKLDLEPIKVAEVVTFYP